MVRLPSHGLLFLLRSVLGWNLFHDLLLCPLHCLQLAFHLQLDFSVRICLFYFLNEDYLWPQIFHWVRLKTVQIACLICSWACFVLFARCLYSSLWVSCLPGTIRQAWSGRHGKLLKLETKLIIGSHLPMMYGYLLFSSHHCICSFIGNTFVTIRAEKS